MSERNTTNGHGVDTATITPGARFSTATPDGRRIETGCIVVTGPDEFGEFVGIDSDGIECGFGVAMVASVEEEGTE